MSVNLQKNEKVSLTKEAGSLGITLNSIALGLGWDCDTINNLSVDLDAWAFAVTNTKRSNETIYFGNLKSRDKSIKHFGDNLTGEGEGDDEVIGMSLPDVSPNIEYIAVGVTIFKGKNKGQLFCDVKNAFIRVYDTQSNKEICRYDISNNNLKCVTLLFGVLRRKGIEWEFIALGKPLNDVGRITEIADRYNLETINNLTKDLNNPNTKKLGGKKSMAVSLSKGGKVSLAKAASDAGVASLTKVGIGLGWDTNRYDGSADFDLDAAAFLVGASGKVQKDEDFIFYNQPNGPGIHHTGDNRTGEGDGDDELIEITLGEIDPSVEKIAFTVTIHEADTRGQNMGMVENAYIRVFDMVTGTEIIRYDLTEDFSIETAIVVGELYRHGGEWKFNAIGSGFSGGLFALCKNFGVNV